MTAPTTEIPLQNVCGEKNPAKFGTFMGVYVPSILMLFGVIIFLRLGWITGEVGLGITLAVVSLGALIALLTVLSMGAIATNIEMGKGGIYYILSRSLGVDVGAALGIPLYLNQSLNVAFCVMGFSESLHDIFPELPITSIGIVTISVLTVASCVSLQEALKAQFFIFLLMILSLASLFTGQTIRPPTITYEPTSIPLSFWAAFAIFFPAMTGMESSVSLSGDLRNPSRSLPIGTIAALLTGYAVYMLIPIFLIQHVPLDRLRHDTMVIQDLASIPALIPLGIWAATLSSALGGLLGAPRTLQAIAEDKIVPAIFKRTYGRNQEPVLATLFTFLIALTCIILGSINQIAPMLTMICLICYGVLNLSAGLETLMSNPSWRPRFRVHWALSFLGFFLCLAAMLMINAGCAMLALCLILAIYFLNKRRQIKASWEDITQGLLLFISRFAIYRLADIAESSKSWRPHFLVFSKNPEEQTNCFVKITQAISQSKSFLNIVSFLPTPISSEVEKKNLTQSIRDQLKLRNIDAITQISYAKKVTEGMQHILEHAGFGPLSPNTVVFGGVQEDNVEFAQVIQSAYQRNYNIVIFNDQKNSEVCEKTPDTNPSDIHIWWDNLNQQNGDFMLVLAYMLQRNPAWNKTRIHLNDITDNELNRVSKLKEFRELGIKRRLPLDVTVYVAPNSTEERNLLIRNFSKNASLVFIGLRPPSREELSQEYAAYLKDMFETANDFPPTALILGSEDTPFENIFK